MMHEFLEIFVAIFRDCVFFLEFYMVALAQVEVAFLFFCLLSTLTSETRGA